MGKGISKNARSGVKIQKFTHKCGGEIKMKSVFKNGKLKHFAECLECGEKSRKPKDMRLI